MKIKTKSFTLFFILIILAVVAMVFIPFLGIWCINTLFSVSILYTWKNWVAFFLLSFVINMMSNIAFKFK
jgi:hypothetical protein